MFSKNVEWPYFYSFNDKVFTDDGAFSESFTAIFSWRLTLPLAAEALDRGHKFVDRRLSIAGLDCSAFSTEQI